MGLSYGLHGGVMRGIMGEMVVFTKKVENANLIYFVGGCHLPFI